MQLQETTPWSGIHIAVNFVLATSCLVRVCIVVWIFIAVFVVVLVAHHDFVDPIDVVAHSSEDGRMFGAGARAPRPAGYPFQRPVERIAAKTSQGTTGVALAGALAALRVPGTQHRRLDEVVVPRMLVALLVWIVFHRYLVQAFQRTPVRCTHDNVTTS